MKFCRSESLDFLCLWVSARRWYWPTTSSYVWLCVYIWPELCLTLSRLIYFSSGSRANLHLGHFAKAFVCLISHYLFPFSFFPCIASSTRIIERSETCFLQNIYCCSLVLHWQMASFSKLQNELTLKLKILQRELCWVRIYVSWNKKSFSASVETILMALKNSVPE